MADKHNTMFSKENSWFLPLFSELTVTNLAHFSVLAVLTIHLVNTVGFSSGETAMVLFATSAGLRFSRILLAPFIDKFPPRRVIACAIFTSLVGYLGMLSADTALSASLCMLLVGTGYGLNGMLVTTLASYTAQRSPSAFPIYALMNSGTNIAAALAPPLSNWLRLDVSPHMPFIFSAAMLGVSLLISLRIHAATPASYRDTHFWSAVLPLLKRPGFLVTLGVIALGWAVYTQKFSATPLFIDRILMSPLLIGTAVAINALIVLLISMPIATYIRLRHIPGRRVLGLSFLLYAAAYLLLSLMPTLTGFWISLIVWSLGEAMLMPQLNALVAEMTRAEDRLAAFSLAAIAIGVGEAAGNAGGVLLFNNSAAWLCYALLAAFALFSFAYLTLMEKSHASPTPAAS